MKADTPGNMEATPVNGAAPVPAGPAAVMPGLVVVPASPEPAEMVTALVTTVMWVAAAWWAQRAQRPRP